VGLGARCPGELPGPGQRRIRQDPAPGGVIEHLKEEEWASALQLKFMGYVRCMKHVLPIMQKQKKGRVVNVIGNDGVKVSYWEVAPGADNAAGQNLTL